MQSGSCGRSGRRRGRGLVWSVGFADVVGRAEVCCWVERIAQGLKRVGSGWWLMGRDCGRVLRYAQDDRLRGRRWDLVWARRIEAWLNCAEMDEHRLWRWLAPAWVVAALSWRVVAGRVRGWWESGGRSWHLQRCGWLCATRQCRRQSSAEIAGGKIVAGEETREVFGE
jgi:hypothetical protein